MQVGAERYMAVAARESERLGDSYIGTEHLLLGLLRERNSAAARALESHGLVLSVVERGLARLDASDVGSSVGGDAVLLAELGIDLEEVRRRAVSSFGPDAVAQATRRVMRRPWWRGRPAAWTPLCGKPVLIKRALEFAVAEADRRGDTALGSEHVLLGLLHDAADPVGTGLSRGSRASLSRFGMAGGGPSRVRRLLAARGITPEELCRTLGAAAVEAG